MGIVDAYAIHQYHRERLREFGEGSCCSLGWKDAAGQEARFKVLSEIGNLDNASVLDAGCGHGDLCASLHHQFTGLRYVGIDQEEAFLQTAIKKCSHLPDTSFFHGDFLEADLPLMDYVLASGALNYRHSDPGFIFKAITTLFYSCRIGLGFNLLSRVEDPNGLLVAYEKDVILEHCRSLGPDVLLKEGYYEHDFTVLMKHDLI